MTVPINVRPLHDNGLGANGQGEIRPSRTPVQQFLLNVFGGWQANKPQLFKDVPALDVATPQVAYLTGQGSAEEAMAGFGGVGSIGKGLQYGRYGRSAANYAGKRLAGAEGKQLITSQVENMIHNPAKTSTGIPLRGAEMQAPIVEGFTAKVLPETMSGVKPGQAVSFSARVKAAGNVKTKLPTVSKAQKIIKFAEEKAAAGSPTYTNANLGPQRSLPPWESPWSKVRTPGIVNNTFHAGPSGTAVTEELVHVGPRVRTGNPGSSSTGTTFRAGQSGTATSNAVERYTGSNALEKYTGNAVERYAGAGKKGNVWGKRLAELAAVTAGATAIAGGYEAMKGESKKPNYVERASGNNPDFTNRAFPNAPAPNGSSGSGKATPGVTVPQNTPGQTRTDSTTTKKVSDGTTSTTTKSTTKPEAPKATPVSVTPAVDKAISKITGPKTIPTTTTPEVKPPIVTAPVVAKPLPTFGELSTDYSDNMSAADMERIQGNRAGNKPMVYRQLTRPSVDTKTLATKR